MSKVKGSLKKNITTRLACGRPHVKLQGWPTTRKTCYQPAVSLFSDGHISLVSHRNRAFDQALESY